MPTYVGGSAVCALAATARRAIVTAASELFAAQGYGATTVDAVAAAAGVSRKTVFTAVGGKLDLLKTALDWAVAGDDRQLALADRSDVRGLLDQTDPEKLI
ncbi:MAG: TetR family transcriptional regulator, partial [Mycobacterium sp.]